MPCCADVQVTYGKQQTLQLWMVWILLFSEVTPFEYNVSTILLPIVELSTTEKSWKSKPGNSLMEPLPPFPPQSYILVNLMETQEGEKVPVEVVNSIISESLDRKCTISLIYYKQKIKTTKRCLTGNDISWCHNQGNSYTWLDLCSSRNSTVQVRTSFLPEPLFTVAASQPRTAW